MWKLLKCMSGSLMMRSKCYYCGNCRGGCPECNRPAVWKPVDMGETSKLFNSSMARQPIKDDRDPIDREVQAMMHAHAASRESEWARKVNQELQKLDGSISCTIERSTGPSVLFSRTTFQNQPDPLKRPRCQQWTFARLNQEGVFTLQEDSAVAVAKYLVRYWTHQKAQADLKLKGNIP